VGLLIIQKGANKMANKLVNKLETYLNKNTVFFNEKDEVVDSIESSIYAELNNMKVTTEMSEEDVSKVMDTINIDIEEKDILNCNFEISVFSSSTLYLENLESINELKLELVSCISTGIEMTNYYMAYMLRGK